MDIMLIGILALVVVSIMLVIWGIFGVQRRTLRFKLPEQTIRMKEVSVRSVFGAIFPFTRGILEKFGWDIKLKNRIDAAHVILSAHEFFNIKLLMLIGGGVAAFFGFGGLDNIGALAGGCAIGYFLPDFWLNKRIAQRKETIARILPETVDLLGLCVEAGLDFTTAAKWVIEKVQHNPLIEELAFVLEEIKWGKSRTQALRDMAKRLNVSEVSSFVQTLVQAERMGTPVSEAFTILSEDTRLQRFHRGERYAMQAPIKILIPLIFCILPVIAIVVGGPIFLQFMQGGMLKGLGGK